MRRYLSEQGEDEDEFDDDVLTLLRVRNSIIESLPVDERLERFGQENVDSMAVQKRLHLLLDEGVTWTTAVKQHELFLEKTDAELMQAMHALPDLKETQGLQKKIMSETKPYFYYGGKVLWCILPGCCLRRRVISLVDSTWFDYVILGIIFLNCAMLPFD